MTTYPYQLMLIDFHVHVYTYTCTCVYIYMYMCVHVISCSGMNDYRAWECLDGVQAGIPDKVQGWLPLRFAEDETFTFVHVIICRYRLSSGNGETSSSEDERYDRKEAKIYNASSSANKAPDTTAKVPAAEGNNDFGNFC